MERSWMERDGAGLMPVFYEAFEQLSEDAMAGGSWDYFWEEIGDETG